jgi:uncharacterized protein (TIGR00255 family)
MTGFGQARRQNERLAVTIEARSVNNKHLKVSVRCPDSYLTLEHDIEKLVRQRIARGTVYVNLYADRLDRAHDQGLDGEVLRHYWTQVLTIAKQLGAAPPAEVSALLPLPGVVIESRHHLIEEEDWPLIEGAAQEALNSFQAFRIHEGQAMAAELTQLTDGIESHVAQVAERAPRVVTDFRDKIRDRVRELLANTKVHVQDADLIREVSLFADRCDVTEEITRLRCHCGQFRAQFQSDQQPGRKLDFLCQEMFREINTIGSKANDVEIAHLVVDLKTAVEKMRELVQNVE